MATNREARSIITKISIGIARTLRGDENYSQAEFRAQVAELPINPVFVVKELKALETAIKAYLAAPENDENDQALASRLARVMVAQNDLRKAAFLA